MMPSTFNTEVHVRTEENRYVLSHSPSEQSYETIHKTKGATEATLKPTQPLFREPQKPCKKQLFASINL